MDEPPRSEQPKPPSRRLLILGGLAALIAGIALAWVLLAGGRGEKRPPPPASQGGLIIEQGAADTRIDPARPLRCFVAGQSVGELTLKECAQRNGVATDALDVGIDETGALAAAQGPTPLVAPLPVEPSVAEPAPAAEPAPEAAPAPEPQPATALCQRFDKRWKPLGEMSLGECVQELFAGRCGKRSDTPYGRFGAQSLRLVSGRVEISSDETTYRLLASQGANCSIPPIG